ncbi:MAG TPA: hypothetical protein IAB61_13685 [Candidatus Merdisoma merdipullorum]|nr:hypothetical protein [Candidatus Merdisoma merdipullorum]
MTANSILVTLLIFFGTIIGMIVLQIFLSRTERRWPGLILPICTLLYALLVCMNVVRVGSLAETVLFMALLFLLFNIPTYILLAIYFICRQRRKKRKMLDKMNIQDLN